MTTCVANAGVKILWDREANMVTLVLEEDDGGETTMEMTYLQATDLEQALGDALDAMVSN